MSGPQTSQPYRAMGSITDSSIFSQILIVIVKFDVRFDGVEGPSCLVSQLVHSFVEVTRGTDMVCIVFCLL